MADQPAGIGGIVVQAMGSRWLIPVTHVIEVLRESRIIMAPGAVPAVRGMANHRGRIITVADPIRALDIPGDSGAAREVVVVEWGGRRFGLAVDGVVELGREARTGLAEMDLERIASAIFA